VDELLMLRGTDTESSTDPPAAATHRPSIQPTGNASIATKARPVSRWWVMTLLA